MSKPSTRLGRIAILWRGDEAARRSTAPETSRFKAIFAALSEIGAAVMEAAGANPHHHQWKLDAAAARYVVS